MIGVQDCSSIIPLENLNDKTRNLSLFSTSGYCLKSSVVIKVYSQVWANHNFSTFFWNCLICSCFDFFSGWAHNWIFNNLYRLLLQLIVFLAPYIKKSRWTSIKSLLTKFLVIFQTCSKLCLPVEMDYKNKFSKF